jgi:hypothetical protein
MINLTHESNHNEGYKNTQDGRFCRKEINANSCRNSQLDVQCILQTQVLVEWLEILI